MQSLIREHSDYNRCQKGILGALSEHLQEDVERPGRKGEDGKVDMQQRRGHCPLNRRQKQEGLPFSRAHY